MDQIRIDHSEHPLYHPFKELYSASFPVFEQRTRQQQEAAFSSPRYRLTGYKERDYFIGFISCWEFQEYVYIEHFAIDKAQRGNGYGSRLLKDFITEAAKIVLLEIDPVIDSVSEARLRFYKKCGFYENPYPHIHPPYRSGYDGHSLVILTTQRVIAGDEYKRFGEELRSVVMNRNEITGI